MTTPIDNSNKKHAFQIKGNGSLLSKNGVRKDSNIFEKEMSSALESLSKLENSEQLREDAIKNGKAIIANWKTPSDQQIDTIISKMGKIL